jgi:hypothetical protein
MSYQLTSSPEIIVRLSDLAFIPADPRNQDYQTYLAWMAEGNTALPAPPPEPEPLLPVSPRQIRQALTRAGLRTAVEAAIAAGDQDGKDWWEFATQFERQHPTVVAMGHTLNQTDAQMDALWALAASL